MANMSIKSRLLMMLLGVSAISITIVASLSYYACFTPFGSKALVS